MAYEMKEMTGSLFKNERREKDTHAHAKGSALIGGVEYWIDAWTNETKDGQKYQSLKFKAKNERPVGGSMATQVNTQVDHDLDDDVPF